MLSKGKKFPFTFFKLEKYINFFQATDVKTATN